MEAVTRSASTLMNPCFVIVMKDLNFKMMRKIVMVYRTILYCHECILEVLLCFADIDECVMNQSPCGNNMCINNVGSFECICDSGYIKVGINTCLCEHLPNKNNSGVFEP